MRRRVGWLVLLAGCAEAPSAPSVTGFAPQSGSARGGDRLEVYGDLPDDARIVLGGVALPTQATEDGVAATTPPGFAGPQAVAVRVGEDLLELDGAFTYEALDLRWVAAAAGYLPDGRAQDAVALDFDGDGAVDLALADPALGLVLWTNTGHGGFEASVLAPGDARALAAGDLDGDGRDDLLGCFGAGEPDSVWLGGVRRALRSSSACTAAAVVDGAAVLLGGGGGFVRVLRADAGPASWAPVPGQETPADVTGLTFPGAFGVGEVTGVALLGAMDGDGVGHLTAEAAGAGTVGALFPVWTDLPPIGASVLSSVPARLELTDATGEVFTWSGGPLAAAIFDGDGIFDAPADGLAVVFDVGPGTVDITLDDVVLDVGVPVVLEDFDRATFALSGPPGDAAVAGTADGGLCLGRPDGAPGLRCAVLQDGVWIPGDAGAVPEIDAGVAGIVAVGDDLLLATTGQDRLLRGDGAGHYFDDTWTSMPVDASVARAARAADLDRDGMLDVVVANDGIDRVLHQEDGRFVDWTARTPLRDADTRRVVPADVDGDGDLDLVLLGDDPPELWVAVDR